MSSDDNSTSAALSNLFGGDPDSGSQGIDVDVVKGLTIIGIVVAVLFTLILLRFGCNICIDLIILRDFDAFMRSISKARRIVLPWFHPRAQPHQQHGRGDDHDEENGNVDGVVTELTTIDMDQVLTGLTPQQKQGLVEQVLTTKSVTLQDIQRWKSVNDDDIPEPPYDRINDDNHSNSSNNKGNTVRGYIPQEQNEKNGPDNDNVNISTTSQDKHQIEDCDDIGSSRSSSPLSPTVLCPICIHDIEVGNDAVVLSSCKHVFHKNCLCQWLSTHTRDCPYCRTEIITQEMIEEVYRLRNLRSQY